jgi:UDP-N-acetylmuramate--alanine ligase
MESPGALDLPTVGQAHLIGACGTGMASLASVLAGQGWRLTASDRCLHAAVVLPGKVRVSPGHSPRYVAASSNLVIYSGAVPSGNCERRRAARLGIPCLNYSQMLGLLMRDRLGIAVAGTHGKSTTTAMLAEILIRAGLDPTVVMGAIPAQWRTGGRPGRGRYVLVEACEYRGNFRHLNPQAALLLNLEAEHFDSFGSIEHQESAFAEFIGRVPDNGLVVARGDDRRLRELCHGARARVVTFGSHENASWRAVQAVSEKGRYRFEVWKGGRRFTDIRLSVAGRHQVENALAAVTLAGELGIGGDVVRVALEDFRGVSRRTEEIGAFGGVTLVDDVAHHPTTIHAALATVRETHPGRRVVCIFEPCQASRLRHLLDETAQSLQNADRVLVTSIHHAREKPEPCDDLIAELVRRIADGRASAAAVPFRELLDRLREEVRRNDVVVTLGDGPVERVQHAFAQRLRRDPPAR